MKNDTYHFRTNTLLKNLVGKDLINDDKIAVIELVKNSIDADSSEIIIKFTNFPDEGSTTKSQLIISDNGIGMDLNDIRDKWLNIAYSDKKNTRPENQRFYAGNKGIGRFSCDRLGKDLDLITRKENGELLHLHINWEDFEIDDNKDLTIQEIPIDVEVIKDELDFDFLKINTFPKSGTILIISRLRNSWDSETLSKLKTALEKFINPNQLFQKEKINIYLSIPEIENTEKGKEYNERITGKIRNQIFEKLKFNTTYIESMISTTGDRVTTKLWHEGEKVFELTEKNDSYPLIPDTYVIIYFLNPYKKAYFKRQTGVRTINFGSVFLFLNGFRISPYGDRGDDWLEIDVRKSQGTRRFLGSRDIIGRIEIFGNEDQYKPVSSREGLKQTPEFRQLREKFFIDILRKLEKFVVEDLQWDSVPSHIRQELISEDGIDWKGNKEEYKESWDIKKQRTISSLMTLIGSSPDKIIEFWFNPALLEGVYETKQEEVKKLLAEINNINPVNIDQRLLRNLSRINKIIEQKESDAQKARSEAADLRVEVSEQQNKIIELEEKQEIYKAQTIFLRHVTSIDVEQLLEFHHQIDLDTNIVNNYLSRSIKALREKSDKKNVIDLLQKAIFITNRISTISQFATKANFSSGLAKEPTDIPAYIEQYIYNVSKNHIAHDINITINNEINELFEMEISRVELSMLIDNFISNSKKSSAKNLIIQMFMVSSNTIRISFIDDGKGLSQKLPNIESIFEPGITTTTGSGLGLYHAKNIVNKLDGSITAIPNQPKGLEIRVELTR
ncbi:sensor histidine kinase [Chloroflexota bacterium]|nr:sensor histidine kinase [Chloroflexota bacterium]